MLLMFSNNTNLTDAEEINIIIRKKKVINPK